MTDILNLPYYTATEVRENDFDYLIFAHTTLPPRACPQCQSLDFIRHGAREPVFMDIPIHGKRVGVKVIRQRYRCKACNAVFVDPLVGLDENRAMTSRLIHYVRTESFKRTFTSIADDVGVDEKTIRNVFKEYVEILEAQYKLETPEWLGIDEIHILHQPRCVLTNVKERTLIEMLKTRNKPVVARWLSNLKDKNHIQVVTMDMWTPYREAVEAVLPNAAIVVDRYHVVRLANKALDDFRKATRDALSDSQRRQLMHDRFILLRRPKDLTDKDRLLLDVWTSNLPLLGIAYNLKEAFFNLYDLPDKAEAEKQYKLWCESVEANKEIAPYFSDTIRAVTNWHDYIFNFFDYEGATNAYTESINGLIKIANRIGRGYSFDAIRAKMLFRDGHVIKGKPKFDRTQSEGLGMTTIKQPDEDSRPTSLGVPITTLTDMIDHGDL